MCWSYYKAEGEVKTRSPKGGLSQTILLIEMESADRYWIVWPSEPAKSPARCRETVHFSNGDQDQALLVLPPLQNSLDYKTNQRQNATINYCLVCWQHILLEIWEFWLYRYLARENNQTPLAPWCLLRVLQRQRCKQSTRQIIMSLDGLLHIHSSWLRNIASSSHPCGIDGS